MNEANPPPPASGGVVTPARPSEEERRWAMFAHLSILLGGLLSTGWAGGIGYFIGPLIIWQIKKNGGMVVGGTGIPLGTADMTPFLSKIRGNFDGLFASSSAGTGWPSAIRPSISASPRSTNGQATAGSSSQPTCGRSAIRSRVLSASTAICRYSMVHSTHPRTGSFSKRPRRASNRLVHQTPVQTASSTRTSHREWLPSCSAQSLPS